MSKEAETRIIELGTGGKEVVDPALEERARQTFYHAIKRSGGLALTPDGTLAYIDDWDSPQD